MHTGSIEQNPYTALYSNSFYGIYHMGYFFEAYRQIENNFTLDLRNRVFLSELERLTMFSTIDSLDHANYANSVSLYIETTSLSFKHKPKSTKIELHIL
ncbi:hypothetical protein Glove_85g73 [Diversispora epigaea]|uniref:Uncharacterized protein n=1 Tax=Diversispora epigaea TaxID=1348612 RepID=A0A397JB88_9GLOM|nr:hypothetical protein Glove_85g73 [Diversispora epigaea]